MSEGVVFPTSVVETHRVTVRPGGDRVEVEAQHFVVDGAKVPFVAYKVTDGKVFLWDHPPLVRRIRQDGGGNVG